MDQGLKFDSEPVMPITTQPRKNRLMSKFKLELGKKTVDDKIPLGANHITSMNGNANYPQSTRVPSDAQVQAAQDDLVNADAAANAAETTWKQLILVRNEKEAAWDTVITARANNCEAVTPNNLPALQSTGFPLRSAPAPVGALPAPSDLKAKPTDNEGEIDLRCDVVPGASSYEWQCRLYEGTTGWSGIKTGTSVRILVSGLNPGVMYAFRVRAIGSVGPGTWSDEAVERAP
jgi:hypothetical protein